MYHYIKHPFPIFSCIVEREKGGEQRKESAVWSGTEHYEVMWKAVTRNCFEIIHLLTPFYVFKILLEPSFKFMIDFILGEQLEKK